MFSLRYMAALVVSGVLFCSVEADAYTNQWEWRVIGVYWGTSLDVAGPSTTYSTKEEALAVMRGLSPPYSNELTQDDGVSTMSQGAVRYRYSARRPTPTYTDWIYTAFTPPLATEAEWVAARKAYYDWFCNCEVTVEPNGEWSTVDPDTFWSTGTEYQARPYLIHSQGQISPDPIITSAVRQRTQDCGVFGLGFVPYECPDPNYFGSIEAHPLECPVGGPPTGVGNPCDVVTGNKSQTEIDYIGSDVKFTRHYNSATLAFDNALGVGWTHNYAAKLILNGNVPKGLIRASGHHDVIALIAGQYVSLSGASLHIQQEGGQWRVSLSDGSAEIYDGTGKLIQLMDRAGRTTTLSYTGNQLDSVAGPFGHTLQFNYSDGLLESIADPPGELIRYGHDGSNNLTQVTYQDGTSRIYHYEKPGFPNHLTGITDESSQRFAAYAYDSNGRVTSSEHAGGHARVSLTYGPFSTSVLNAAGGTSVYNFTASATESRRVSSLSRGGKTTSYVVASSGSDQQRRVTQKSDERGTLTTYAFDRDHLTSMTEALGTPRERTRTFQYLSANDSLVTYESLSSVASGGLLREVLTTFNSQRLPWVITHRGYHAGGSTDRITTLLYDSFGRLTSADGPRTDANDVTTIAYYTCTTGNECGQLNTVTNALGHATTYSLYNAHGIATRVTDPSGIATNFTYDLRGRLRSTQSGSETTTYDYYPTGLLQRVTLPDGGYLHYTYNAAHVLTEIRDAEDNRILYTPHISGEGWTARELRDPSGALSRTQSRVYNALNQLTRDIGAAQQTTLYAYDDSGNLDTVTDPLNRVTNLDYDELQRLLRVTDPALGVTELGYDANDNLASIVDPRTLSTTYQFNGHGDLIRLTSPDTGITQYTPDAAGNADVIVDARNRSGDYIYDAINRVSAIIYSDQTVGFEYDQGINAIGRMTRMTDGSGNTQWSYDTEGRVETKQQTVGAVVRSVHYDHNTSGQLSEITTPSGQAIGYTYANGRVTAIAVNGATLLNQVLYEPFGPVRGWSWANGTLTVREYDTDWRLGAIDSAGLSTYGYFANGQIQSQADDTPVSFTLPAGITNYTPASTSNRIASSTGVQARTYIHDAAGHATSDGSRSLNYDDAGRLVSATAAGVTTMYQVNALGQRVRKSNASLTRIFVYDEPGRLVGEYDASGNLVQETVWFDEIPVATLRPKAGGGIDVFYIHTDHLNTPRKISRPTDNVVLWRWASDPFGQAAAAEDVDGDTQLFQFNLRFPGQYFDSETGLNYNYYRDYDPQIGRYIQSDPIGLRGGINTYAYVGNAPTMLIDPFGLIDLKVPGAGGETSIHANPGPDVVPPGARREHLPHHIHVGNNSGPRISTDTFEPLTPDDARRLTQKQKKFCKNLSDQLKGMIRDRQRSVFKYGKVMSILAALPAVSLDSLTAACKQDPFWCAENTPDVFDRLMEKFCEDGKCEK